MRAASPLVFALVLLVASPSGAEPPPVVTRAPPRLSRAVTIGVVTTSAMFGALCLGVASDLALRARDQADALSRLPPGVTWTPDLNDRYFEGKASAVAATTLFVVGGAALGTGVLVGVLGRRTLARR